MKYQLCKEVMANDALRKTYNELATKTFGLSFEEWYQSGYWTETNIPYTLLDGGQAVSNISVNRMELLWQGEKRNYIQIGTVMTDTAYRNRGLSCYIMEEIIKDWETKCDAIFLFANKSVLEFYPKFGFKKGIQYQFNARIKKAWELGRKLDMHSLQDQQMLRTYYEKNNPFSKVQAINNFGLLMFYCQSFMKDCVYYSPEYDAIVIAEQEDDCLNCYDVYCNQGNDLMEIISSVASVGTQIVNLKFTPVDSSSFEVKVADNNDDTLFVLSGKENLFEQGKILFPEISHT